MGSREGILFGIACGDETKARLAQPWWRLEYPLPRVAYPCHLCRQGSLPYRESSQSCEILGLAIFTLVALRNLVVDPSHTIVTARG